MAAASGSSVFAWGSGSQPAASDSDDENAKTEPEGGFWECQLDKRHWSGHSTVLVVGCLSSAVVSPRSVPSQRGL